MIRYVSFTIWYGSFFESTYYSAVLTNDLPSNDPPPRFEKINSKEIVTYTVELAKPELTILEPRGFHLKLTEVPEEAFSVELYSCLLKPGGNDFVINNLKTFTTEMEKTDINCFETKNNDFVFQNGDRLIVMLWYELRPSAKYNKIYRNTYRMLFYDKSNITVIFKNN